MGALTSFTGKGRLRLPFPIFFRRLFLTGAALLAHAASSPEAQREAGTGVALAHDGKYREAIGAYRRAIALDPELPNIQLNLGLAYFKLRDLAHAAPAFERALRADAGNFQVQALLGMSYFGLGRFADAVAPFEKATGAQPENVELRHKLAESCLYSGHYTQALREFEALLRAHPDSAPVHMFAAQALDALGESDAAIKELKAAAKAAPGLPTIHFGLGYLYWKYRNFEAAEREFRAELKIDPDNAGAAAYLGNVLLKAGKDGEAMAWLKRALGHKEESALALLDIGVIHANRREYAEALTMLRKAARVDPGRADVHYRLASVYKSLGRTEEAKKELADVSGLHKRTDQEIMLKVTGPPKRE